MNLRRHEIGQLVTLSASIGGEVEQRKAFPRGALSSFEPVIKDGEQQARDYDHSEAIGERIEIVSPPRRQPLQKDGGIQDVDWVERNTQSINDFRAARKRPDNEVERG